MIFTSQAVEPSHGAVLVGYNWGARAVAVRYNKTTTKTLLAARANFELVEKSVANLVMLINR